MCRSNFLRSKDEIKAGQTLARFAVPVLLVLVLGFTAAYITPAKAQTEQDSVPEIYHYGSDLYDPMLQRVRVLVRANVLELAQNILENEGPPLLPNQAWLDWERQLWTLYRVQEDWDALYNRTRALPPAFPNDVKTEADSEAIMASISGGQAVRARSLLRRNIASGTISELDKRQFRKSLIESYLADGLLLEAEIAMEDYQADYRSNAEDWLLLSAQVNLRLNNADAAVNLLAPLDSPAARLLRVYARLKNNTISPDEAIASANALLEAPDIAGKIKRHQAMSVIVVAELIADRLPQAIDAMEQYIEYTSLLTNPDTHTYPHFGINDLIETYSAFSKEMLLQDSIDSDDMLIVLDYVYQLADFKTISRKSLCGYLLTQVRNDSLRRQVNDLFTSTLILTDRTRLISLLYGDDQPFGPLELGGGAGVELSNVALQEGNIQLAALASTGLVETPESMDPLEWKLHVARISIIAGDYRRGVDNLADWIESHERLTPAQADRVLQPVFDLQTVHQHEYALELLHRIYKRVYHSTKHRREIAYWIAESYQGTEDHLKAADYFLFSAMQHDDGFDQWGKSARYRAADSLQSASMIEDSRKLIEGLLANADDEGRRIQLQHKIQELWLIESGADSGAEQ